MLACPFCGAGESDRFLIEERLYVVFPCMFTAKLDPTLPEEQMAVELETRYGGQGGPFFRRTCDVLHLYVTKGAGATILRSEFEPEVLATEVPPPAPISGRLSRPRTAAESPLAAPER